MMSGMPLETFGAFNERWNNKFYYKVASCWLFLQSQNIKSYKNLSVFEVQNLCSEGLVFTGLKIGLSLQRRKGLNTLEIMLIEKII